MDEDIQKIADYYGLDNQTNKTIEEGNKKSIQKEGFL